ncbi:unannotated protein [freshwater metagenome]|uniref:Unannotated protein n=1 Tax=freshwater metagenome TaxID=449393 RepID=A0A6J6I5U2_9ZZZZ
MIMRRSYSSMKGTDVPFDVYETLLACGVRDGTSFGTLY